MCVGVGVGVGVCVCVFVCLLFHTLKRLSHTAMSVIPLEPNLLLLYYRDGTVRQLTVGETVHEQNWLINCKSVNRPFVSFSDTKSVTLQFNLRGWYYIYITILIY